MSDATDFVPTEAKIEGDKAYFLDNVKNLAADKDISDKIRGAIEDYETRFTGQRSKWAAQGSGIWAKCDWAFRCCLNDTETQREKSVGANEPALWERAKTGTTQFFRQVMQKAANGYAVMTSKDMPFRYESLHEDETKDAEGRERAERKNLLAKWTMKKDRFNTKSLDFWTQIYKYGNIPVLVEWHQRKGTKKVPFPVYDEADPTTIKEYRNITVERVVENRPVISILPVESVKADSTIGCIQDQECVIVSSVVGMAAIVDGIKTGIYRDDLLKDLSRSHQWDGHTGFENQSDKDDNHNGGTDCEMPFRQESGRYLKREVWINVPIDDEDESWDNEKNIPLRYRVTLFGNSPHDSLVARVERNQEPDDAIPIEMIHAYPDDSDYLYHISPFEVIRSNIATETTLIRQVIDNNTLVNKPPLWEREGAVRGTDRSFGPDARWVVDDKDSIGQFNTRDISQPTLGILDYLKDDSNQAQSMDRNMVGESYGARTSAQEAGTIAASSQRPNIVNIGYILEQFLGFIAKRYDVLWPVYSRVEQVIQITDEKDMQHYIKPREIEGEFDIVVDIINEIKDNELKAQRMLNYAQVAASIPPMAQTTDWAGLNKELQEYMLGTCKYVVQGTDYDAEEVAMRNVLLMLNTGQYPQMNPGMNLRKHLDIYKSARIRYEGMEDTNPNIAILDQVIAQIEFQMKSQGGTYGGGMIQAPQSASVQGGQQISGMHGALQG